MHARRYRRETWREWHVWKWMNTQSSSSQRRATLQPAAGSLPQPAWSNIRIHSRSNSLHSRNSSRQDTRRDAPWKSGLLTSGQPSVAKGKRPELNHVSSTSSSWRRLMELAGTPKRAAAAARASSSVRPTTQYRWSALSPAACPATVTWYAGMRWPHHSCREMHQSWMLSSQLNQVVLWKSGTRRSSPERTASAAALAMPPQLTYHCGLMSGSITSPERLHRPRRILLSALPRCRPFSVSAFSTASRASKRISPAKGPPLSLMRPSSLKTVMKDRPCFLPHL